MTTGGGLRVRGLLPVLAAGFVLAAAACEKHEFHPPDREEQVARAGVRYGQVGWDTITWASDSARAQEGNLVYAADCRRCHGTVGEGQTELAEERELQVPSLVDPEWPYGDSVESVRRRVYTGHPDGMPTFGIARLTPREIDAVAYYIQARLRPEILGGEGG